MALQLRPSQSACALLSLVLTLAGCGEGQHQARSASSQRVVSNANVNVDTSSATGTTRSVPSGNPASAAARSGNDVDDTAAYNSTVHIQVGQQLHVRLRDLGAYSWTRPRLTGDAARLVGLTRRDHGWELFIVGAHHGVAHAVANGVPRCRQWTPPCGVPTTEFSVFFSVR
jgi:hypothetical protein